MELKYIKLNILQNVNNNNIKYELKGIITKVNEEYLSFIKKDNIWFSSKGELFNFIQTKNNGLVIALFYYSKDKNLSLESKDNIDISTITLEEQIFIDKYHFRYYDKNNNDYHTLNKNNNHHPQKNHNFNNIGQVDGYKIKNNNNIEINIEVPKPEPHNMNIWPKIGSNDQNIFFWYKDDNINNIQGNKFELGKKIEWL